MEPLRVIAHSGHTALVNDVSEHSERLHSQPSSRTTCRAKLIVELAHDKAAAAEGYWDSKYGRSLVNNIGKVFFPAHRIIEHGGSRGERVCCMYNFFHNNLFCGG